MHSFAFIRRAGLATLAAAALAAFHPSAAADQAAALPDGGTPIDVLTYHYDNLRTGWNDRESDLTVASVKSAGFGRLHTLDVDSDVLAQPLLVSGYRMPDGNLRDVLVVATENNSVYAFDANSYDVLWHVNLGKPQSADDVGCGHVHPWYGISATPVIDRKGTGQATVYLVSATEPRSGEFHTHMHALRLDDGSAAVPAREIEASVKLRGGGTLSFSAPHQWIRAGLAMNDGKIYIAASSHCDNFASSIAGWVIAYDTSLHQVGAFSTIEKKAGYQLAAIWMAGFAPAIDAGGSVYAVTGNGNFNRGGEDWGETVLKLSPGLDDVESFFTPADFAELNQRDLDFGSGGVMLLPEHNGQKAPPLAVAMGKDHVLYLLNRKSLGGRKSNDAGALQSQRLGQAGTGIWGGPCFWRGPAGGMVYYQSTDDVMRAYAVDTGDDPGLAEVAHGTSQSPYGGSLPVVTSRQGQAGTGVVWVINRHIPQRLEAYDAEHLGDPIFSGDIPRFEAGSAYITPLVANGRVYAGTSKAVVIFGLSQ